MADIKISAGADPGTLLGTDKIPLARAPSTTSFAATMNQVVAFAGAPTFNNVGRNLIHNPLFNVAQRGVSGFNAVSTGWTYGLDRWAIIIGAAGDTYGTAQNAVSDSDRTAIGDEAARYLLTNTFTGGSGASNTCLLSQFMEGARRLAGKTVTVSFWAVASVTLKLGISIDQYFGTGGSPSAAVSGTGQSVTVTGTWARYSMTFTVPSSTGKTLGTAGNDHTDLLVWFSAGSNNATRSGNVGVQSGTINLWGVQLEVGTVATPLEKPDPQQDLARCQRFYQIGYFSYIGYTAATSGFNMSVFFKGTMRASATVALNGSSVVNAPGIVILGNDNGMFVVQAVATVLGPTGMSSNYTASADY